MSSVCGLVGHRTSNLAYITSKGGVNLLTKGTAVKHAAENIRVNAICPATVETELIANLSKEPEVYKSRVEGNPHGPHGIGYRYSKRGPVSGIRRVGLYNRCGSSGGRRPDRVLSMLDL